MRMRVTLIKYRTFICQTLNGIFTLGWFSADVKNGGKKYVRERRKKGYESD
jgi:hypothetical protein